MTRKEKFNDYEGFVEKFKPKKTPDDCYTPASVYEAVKDWACRAYGIDPDKTLRPFWPGGDYEALAYPADAVVLDNPPSAWQRSSSFTGRGKSPIFCSRRP